MTSTYSRCRIHACRRNATSGFQKTQTKPSLSPSNQNPRITSIQTYRPHFSDVKRLLPAAVPRAPIRDVTPSPCFETCGPSPFPLLGQVSLKCLTSSQAPLPRSGQSAWTRGKSAQNQGEEASVQRRHFTPSPRPSLGGSPGLLAALLSRVSQAILSPRYNLPTPASRWSARRPHPGARGPQARPDAAAAAHLRPGPRRSPGPAAASGPGAGRASRLSGASSRWC